MTTVNGLLLVLLGSIAVVSSTTAQSPTPPIHVVLWFDTEDYILQPDDDAAKRLAEMLTRLGVRATFKIVGEKARVLERRGRRDVIAALKRHDIGYHSNTHSQQPTIAVYLHNAGWEDGRAEFFRREAQGARDVARIFDAAPVAYGQPGSAWAPQTAFARAIRDTSDYCRTFHRIPDDVWIGAESISPADYLAMLAQAFEHLASSEATPTDIAHLEGRFTADRYVAEDSPRLWSWPIFPEGFHAPRIMELARLQAWTLKPAVMRRNP